MEGDGTQRVDSQSNFDIVDPLFTVFGNNVDYNIPQAAPSYSHDDWMDSLVFSNPTEYEAAFDVGIATHPTVDEIPPTYYTPPSTQASTESFPKKASKRARHGQPAVENAKATASIASGSRSGDFDEEYNQEEGEEDKAHHHRERNRQAAQKCRRKSKQHETDLHDHEQDLIQRHRRLTAQAAGLKDEVLLLKQEILRHANCDCDFIQAYIDRAARLVDN